MAKKRKPDKPVEKEEENTNDNYYDSAPRNPKPPVGCRACGGPYPLCRDSCPLFD